MKLRRTLIAVVIAVAAGALAATGSAGPVSNGPSLNKIAFFSFDQRDNGLDVMLVNTDGSGAANITHDGTAKRNVDPNWSSNGMKVAFTRYNMTGGADIMVVNANGKGARQPHRPQSHQPRSEHSSDVVAGRLHRLREQPGRELRPLPDRIQCDEPARENDQDQRPDPEPRSGLLGQRQAHRVLEGHGPSGVDPSRRSLYSMGASPGARRSSRRSPYGASATAARLVAMTAARSLSTATERATATSTWSASSARA